MTWEAGWRYGIIIRFLMNSKKFADNLISFQRIYYLSISLTGLPCHREQSIVLMSMVTPKKKLFIFSNEHFYSKLDS